MNNRKINLWLYENHLTNEENNYYAKVQPAGNVNNEDLARLIIEEGSELKEETIYDILMRSDKLKSSLIAQGYALNTPFCYARLSVSGVFKGSSAKFSKKEHQLNSSFRAGSEIKKQLLFNSVETLGVANTNTTIAKVIDNLTLNEDSTITPQNVINIRGEKLKIAGDAPDNGVYFINKSSNAKIKVTQIISNKPQELIVMTPQLEKGNYILEVNTQYTNSSNLLKESRSAKFEYELTVE